MSEKKTPTEILEEVLDEQYKLFEEAVKEGDVPDIIDLGSEITKTVGALMDTRALEVLHGKAAKKDA